MKLVITYDPADKSVYQHFGHCESFLYFDTETGVATILGNNGYEHHQLIGYLINLGVEVLICGGIGSHAIEMFAKNGIKVIPGITGSAEAALKAYRDGSLQGNQGAIHECSHSH